MPNQPTIINSFSFTINGLKISFIEDNEKTILSFDPLATCDLFKNIGFIEDFTTDRNGEPVILFTDKNFPQGYGYELWCDFVKSCPNQKRIAEIIIEHRQEQEYLKELRQFVNYNRFLNYHPELRKTA